MREGSPRTGSTPLADGPGIARQAALLLCVAGVVNALSPSTGRSQFPVGEPPLSADVQVDEIGGVERSQLDTVEAFLQDGQADESVESLRRLMETHGDKLVAADGDMRHSGSQFVRFVTLREFCQMRLARMASEHPEALAIYRRRVDPLARTWYEQGLAERDSNRLGRVIDELFASSYGDDALNARAEMSLEQGDFAAARRDWQRVHPSHLTPVMGAAAATSDTPATIGEANGADDAPGELAPPNAQEESGGESTTIAAPRPIAVLPGLPWWTALHDFDWARRTDELPGLMERKADGAALRETLVYPDSPLDEAAIAARLALVSILEGSAERAAMEIARMRRLYPDSSGRLAGREGPYVELLAALLDESRRWNPPLQRDDWPVFAGNVQRNRASGHDVEIALRPLWSRPLVALDASSDVVSEGRPRVGETTTAILGHHPVARGGVLFVNELTRIRAFHLETGERWPSPIAGPVAPRRSDAESGRGESQSGDGGATEPAGRSIGPDAVRSAEQSLLQPGLYDTRINPSSLLMPRGESVGAPRGTLSLFGDRLFARMGSPVTGRTRGREVPSEMRSFLVGLDLSAEGRLLPGFPIRLDGAEWEQWEFEGSPLVDAERVLIAMRRHDNVGVKLHVVCFDARSGELRWRSPAIVGADSLGRDARDSLTHTLLSRDHDRVFVNTNLGIVACLRAGDGRIDWAVRYPRASFRTPDPDDDDRHFFRDLNPCVVHRDLVIVAPADCDRMFALLAATGQVVWGNEPGRAADAVHLLGVGHGNLIASGDSLYWFRAETGEVVGQFPAPGVNVAGSARPSPRGFGRGLLAGDHVLFPTRDAIHVFEQRTDHTKSGWEPIGVRTIDLAPRGVSGGNLLISSGKLIIAAPDELVVFGE